MELTTTAFEDGGRIPEEFAFCIPHPEDGATLGPNLSPDLSWSDLPDGTRSIALLCFDRSAPDKAEVDAADGAAIPRGVDRPGFYHLVLVDIDPARKGFAKGELSDDLVAQGKPAPTGGLRSGANDYTRWFGGDDAMEGNYHLYDGPCPPPNDSIVHEYVFTAYALDVPELDGLAAEFDGAAALEAMKGHVLDSTSITGTYTLNADLA